MKAEVKRLVELDESAREIASLDELYMDLVNSRPKDRSELEMRQEEAKFARERILKLSLHIKNLLASVESEETPK
jgi:hypothetical protein